MATHHVWATLGPEPNTRAFCFAVSCFLAVGRQDKRRGPSCGPHTGEGTSADCNGPSLKPVQQCACNQTLLRAHLGGKTTFSTEASQ